MVNHCKNCNCDNLFQVVKTSEHLWLLISWVCISMWDGMRNKWIHLGLPTWSDIRHIFSIRREIARTYPKQGISLRDNESYEKRTPSLPARNRKVVETAPTTMFQKLNSKVSQGANSSTASKDEIADLLSRLFHRPRYSKISMPPLESPGLRGKKLLKREHFKKMMSKVTNLKVIHEEGLDKQRALGVQVSLSSLTRKYASNREMEQETFSTTEVHPFGAGEQDFANIVVSDESEPAQRACDMQVQVEISSTGNKQRDLDKTSESSLRYTKSHSSAIQDSVRQSPEHPSTSGFAPGIFLWNPTSSPRKLSLINARIPKFGTMIRHVNVPLSTLENPAQDQTFADVYSGYQGELWVSGIQCQSSSSYNRLQESGSQSGAFNTGCTEENQKCLHQTPALASLQGSLPQTQERSPTVAFSGSQKQSQLSDVKNSQRNQHQPASSYVQLPQLEKILRNSDMRTDMKQSSLEQAPIRDVQTSLQDPVFSMPRVQKLPTYQGQTSSTDPQRQFRTSHVQRELSSRKYTPIPNYRETSELESESQDENLNLQQPIKICPQVPLAANELSGTAEVHEHSSQERELQKRTLQEETSTTRTSISPKTLEKLSNLQQASTAGFPEAISQTRHIEEDHELHVSEDYARAQIRLKAERDTSQKRLGALPKVSKRPVRESSFITEGTTESTSQLSACGEGEMETSSIEGEQIHGSGGGYLNHILFYQDLRLHQPMCMWQLLPLNIRKEDEDRTRQRSSRESSHLQITDNQKTQRKQTFVSSNWQQVG